MSNLREYVKQNSNLINMQTLDVDSGFRFEDEILLNIKKKVFNENTTKLGELYNVRLGGMTGCDKAFVISKEQKESWCKVEPKLEQVIKPLLRGKDILHDYQEDYIIYFEHGFTNTNCDCSDVDTWFKNNYGVIKKHLESVQVTKGNGVFTRQKHFQGDYWWELNRGQCNITNYLGDRILIPVFSKTFNAVLNNDDKLPLSSLIVIKGEDLGGLYQFLNTSIVDKIYSTFISLNTLEGGYVVKNSLLISEIPIPKGLGNHFVISDAILQDLYGLTDAEVAYLLNRG